MTRQSIQSIHRAPPSDVAFAGRVIRADASSCGVRDETGTLVVHTPTPPPLGAWVRCRGTWNGLDVTGTCEVVGLPHATFPTPDGDWRAFTDNQRVRNLRARVRARRAVQRFFDERAFLEVDTPAMVPSPGLDLHLDAYPVEVGEREDPRYLITSPEYQMKRVLAGGVPRIYQLAKCFRRNERGSWHQPEFTMLEWYRTFADSTDVMRDTEELVAFVTKELTGATTLSVVSGDDAHRVDASVGWDRLTVAEAFQRYAGVAVEDVLPDEERFFRVLIESIEPRLGMQRPVWLTHWPASMASLARLHPVDPERPEGPQHAERFEAYVGGVELCNGFGELTDPVEQRQRLERDHAARAAQGLPAYPIDERFLSALEEGLPPCGGNALGFDRLLMLILGKDEIEDTLAIPASRL